MNTLIQHLHVELELVGDTLVRDGVTIVEWRGVRDGIGLLYEMAETDLTTVRRWAFDENLDDEIAAPVDLTSVEMIEADYSYLTTRVGR